MSPEAVRRLCSARPTSERGVIHAMAYVWTDTATGREEDGVVLKVGPAWLPGRLVQWFTVERARALADQIHAACDAVESGAAPRTPRARRGTTPVPDVAQTAERAETE